MNFEIRKKHNSSLWGVYERMGNAFVTHWVEVYWSSFDDCREYVAERQ